MKQPWYERQPRRLLEELRAGEQSGADLRWIEPKPGLVGWEGQVDDIQGASHFLRIIYPQGETKPAEFPLRSSLVQVMDLEDRLFTRVDGALPGRKLLAESKVALVGLGSLGSAVAVHLARAGVSSFQLFDPEQLEPENIVRHAGDLSHLYQPKVMVADAMIRARNPFARVEVHRSSPLWDGRGASPGAFQDLLGQPGALIIVTTADDQVERAINEMAVLAGTPVIYGSVLGAAEHGPSSRPSSRPCAPGSRTPREWHRVRQPWLRRRHRPPSAILCTDAGTDHRCFVRQPPSGLHEKLPRGDRRPSSACRAAERCRGADPPVDPNRSRS